MAWADAEEMLAYLIGALLSRYLVYVGCDKSSRLLSMLAHVPLAYEHTFNQGTLN